MTIFRLFMSKTAEFVCQLSLYFLEVLKSLFADSFGSYFARNWWVYDNFWAVYELNY